MVFQRAALRIETAVKQNRDMHATKLKGRKSALMANDNEIEVGQ